MTKMSTLEVFKRYRVSSYEDPVQAPRTQRVTFINNTHL